MAGQFFNDKYKLVDALCRFLNGVIHLVNGAQGLPGCVELFVGCHCVFVGQFGEVFNLFEYILTSSKCEVLRMGPWDILGFICTSY